jgi:hypothetical protein
MALVIRGIKSRRMRLVGHVARVGEVMNTYSILVGKREGKRPLGRTGCGWEDNIRMDEHGNTVNYRNVVFSRRLYLPTIILGSPIIVSCSLYPLFGAVRTTL